MLSHGLYRLSEKHFKRVEELLSKSFLDDPLYKRICPSDDERKKLLAGYFGRYLYHFAPYFHIYADSDEINGVIVVYDDGDSYPRGKYFLAMLRAWISVIGDTVKTEHGLRTVLRAIALSRYLKSNWTYKVARSGSMHIDYLAVDSSRRGRGISSKLVNGVKQEAESRKIIVTLETHNRQNIPIYEHMGFKTVRTISDKHLCQFCMIA